MKHVAIMSFDELTKAMDFLESNLYALELFEPDLKGEVLLIDGRWRVSVISNTRQGDLFD